MALLHADICIIGNELSGFVSAALLARQGYRVILIDNTPSYETKMLGDYYAPTFPYIWQIPKIGPTAHIFDTLELRTELRQSFGAKSPMALIYDPHERLIFHPETNKITYEIERAFPGKNIGAALSQFNTNSRDPLFNEATFLNETNIWGSLKAKKRIAKFIHAGNINGLPKWEKNLVRSPLNIFLSALSPFVQYRSDLTLESIGAFLTINSIQNGYQLPIFEHASSYAILKSIFAESLLRHGGEIIQQQEIIQIKSYRKKITEIELSGHNNYVPKVVIDASYSRDISTYLSDNLLKESLKTQERLVQNQGQTTIYRFLLPKSLVPKAMPPLAASINFTDEKENRCVLGIFKPWKHANLHQTIEKQPENNLALIVMANWTLEGDSHSGLQLLKKSAKQLFPFALHQRLAEDVIKDEEANYIWPKFSSGGKGANRLQGRPIKTPIANLLRAGRDVAPCLGINGEICIAEAVLKAAEAQLNSKTRALF
ncbi:MAG: hypothetical protein O2897_03805 [bacterium]|nr:hypothetical protein [bacterium]